MSWSSLFPLHTNSTGGATAIIFALQGVTDIKRTWDGLQGLERVAAYRRWVWDRSISRISLWEGPTKISAIRHST